MFFFLKSNQVKFKFCPGRERQLVDKSSILGQKVLDKHLEVGRH